MTAQDIISNMMNGDAFSQWLGIEILDIGEGFCTLEMTTRSDMLNGFGILHGGITYSLADSALAFASNSRGQHAVSIETSISHVQKVGPNEKIRAVVNEKSLSNRIGLYEVEITNRQKELVALFKGTVYRENTGW